MSNQIDDLIIGMLWPACAKSEKPHPFGLFVKCWFIQKVLRINAHVPWPVHSTSRIMCPENIIHGSRTPGLAAGCHIDGRNGIRIGKNVWIGPRVSIISMNHDVNDFSRYLMETPIVIGDNSWLATNCVILPGVELGPHTVVAAGAVVTKSFDEGNQILAGVPAAMVRKLDGYRGE